MPMPERVRVVVESNLRLDLDILPQDVRCMIIAALEFPNPEREQAIRERMWNAHRIPEKIKMWQRDRLPRGFAGRLKSGLETFAIDVDWDDRRRDVPIYTGKWKPVKLRDYQELACARCEEVQQGIWQAPPASGKTVTMLELIRRVRQRSIIVTNKTEIAYQWQKRAKDFLGIDVGILGDGAFDVRDVTVALQQTLWARLDELTEQGFWDMYGLVCLDECHHLPAATFMETIQRFTARYRIGVSGTPERSTGMLPIMEAAIGEVFHVTPKRELVEAGIISKPSVEVVETGFGGRYFPTHDNGYLGRGCGVTHCNRSKHQRVHRNNYTQLMNELVVDVVRNGKIARRIASNRGRTQLVLSRRLKHLDVLRQLCVAEGMDLDRLVPFTGAQSGQERSLIQERAAEGNIVLFSTVADEALDIPALDTLHLVYPAANTEIVKQIVGRIERVHGTKSAPVVYDYRDSGVRVLDKQFWGRWRDIYSPERLTVRGLDTTKAPRR